MSLFARALTSGTHFVKKHWKIALPAFCLAIFGVLGVVQWSHAIASVDFDTWKEAGDAATNPLDMIMVLMAMLFNAIASGVGWMILTVIKIILIPILNYDGFATSRIIGLGWSLVRDVVNMFVVVMLLVIAIFTIVGSPKANWEQQIPRLFIYVIAVNFSRTICGLALDIGNVIMFQFVNAILDVGAGNFAQLLKLNISGSFADRDGEATKAFQLLAQAYLQLALLLAVLAVIGIMALVFIYRIVVLWVLIILSPAAFFLGGIKDVLGQAGSAYSEWWKKFSSAIILGPMLTFFLWLALAAASTGDIVTSENFPVGETETTDGLLLKSFDMSQLAGLMLGLVLLVVGMQQAASAAGSLGGVAAHFINEGMGMRIAKGALRMPAQQFGRQVDRRVGGMIDRSTGQHRGSLASYVGNDLIQSGQRTRAGYGWLGAIPGRALQNVGNRLQGLGAAGIHDAEHNAEERVKAMSEDRLASELELAANGDTSKFLSNKDDQNFAMKRLVTDKKLQKSLEGRMAEKYKGNPAKAKEEFEKIMRGAIGTVELHESDIIGGDEAAGKAFNATKTRYAHLIGAMEGKSASERQRAHLDAEKTDLHDLSEAAIKDEGIRAHLGTLVARTTEDGKTVSKLEDVESGKFGNKLRDKALEAPSASRGSTNPAYSLANRAATLAITSSEDLKVAVTGGDLALGGADGVRVGDFAGTRTYVDASGATVTESIGRNMAKAIALSGRDLTLASNTMNAPAQAAFDMHIQDVIDDTATTVEDRQKAMVAQYLVGKDASKFNFVGDHIGEQRAALQAIVKADPAALRHFDTQVAASPEVRQAVEKSVNQALLTKLGVRAGKLAKGSAAHDEIRDAVTVMQTAIDGTIAAAAASRTRVPDGVLAKQRAILSLLNELA